MNQRVGTDDGERKVIADVGTFGWHCVNILEEDGKPPWAFTIGLFETWQHPELIIVGLKRHVAHSILNIVATGLKTGRRLDLTKLTDELCEGPPTCFVEVSTTQYRDYVGFARWYYGGNAFPLVQIVWPSKDGYFPWNERASDGFKRWQPVLGQVAIGV